MEALGEAVLEMALAVAAAVVAFRALCAAPLATLTAIALLALAIQERVVPVPESALATEIEAAQAGVHRWQDDTADGISCRIELLRGGADTVSAPPPACRPR